MTVHVRLIGPATEQIPPVLVNKVSGRHEHQLGQGHFEQNVDVSLLVRLIHLVADQTQAFVVA